MRRRSKTTMTPDLEALKSEASAIALMVSDPSIDDETADAAATAYNEKWIAAGGHESEGLATRALKKSLGMKLFI